MPTLILIDFTSIFATLRSTGGHLSNRVPVNKRYPVLVFRRNIATKQVNEITVMYTYTKSNTNYGYVHQQLEPACREIVGTGSIGDRLESTLKYLCLLHGDSQDDYFEELYSRIQNVANCSEEQMQELAVDFLKYYSEVCTRCHGFLAAS